MKFLYEENQAYTETHELFSAEEIKAHIDRYFNESRHYFQSHVDKKSLAPRHGVSLFLFGFLTTVLMGFGLYRSLAAGSPLSDPQPALICVLLGVGLVCCLLGFGSLISAISGQGIPQNTPKGKDKTGLMLFSAMSDDEDFEALKKGKGKGKTGKGKSTPSLPRPNTPREEAYLELLGRGRLYEGKIMEIVDLDSSLRQITFHFLPDGQTVRTSSYITESSVDLPLYETLVVLSNGTFTVLL